MAARSFVSAHRLWGAAIAVVLAGCLPRAEQPLAVAVGPFPGYQPLYLARELGWYEPETLRLVEYSAGTQSSRAFRNGVVDVAAVTLDEALLLAAEGLPLRIVAVLHSSTGGIFLPNPALERAGLEPDAAEPEHGQPPRYRSWTAIRPYPSSARASRRTHRACGGSGATLRGDPAPAWRVAESTGVPVCPAGGRSRAHGASARPDDGRTGQKPAGAGVPRRSGEPSLAERSRCTPAVRGRSHHDVNAGNGTAGGTGGGSSLAGANAHRSQPCRS